VTIAWVRSLCSVSRVRWCAALTSVTLLKISRPKKPEKRQWY